MQNENNSGKNWKQKLESIESFPAEMRMNKEDAWRKLEAKIQHQPKRRKAFWYWAAAACLLPLVFLLLPALHHNGSDMAKKNSHTNNAVKPSVKQTIPTQKEVAIAKTSVPVLQKKRLTKKPEVVTQIADKNLAQTLAVNNDSATLKIAAITNNENDSNSAKTIASTQQIKKLKVVHINELNDPAEASPMLVHTFSVHPFPLQIARGEVHGNDVKTIHNTSFISFTTKPLTN